MPEAPAVTKTARMVFSPNPAVVRVSTLDGRRDTDLIKGASGTEREAAAGAGNLPGSSSFSVFDCVRMEMIDSSWQGRLMRGSPAHLPDAFKSAAQGIASVLAQGRDCAELDMIFASRIEGLG